MKNKRKKEFYSLLLFLIILGITLGYAALSATLKINGSSQVKNNTWDIHFENVVVNPGSVSIGTGDQAATITVNNTTEVTYAVTLSKPGDFYEFTVDAVNAGTVDGMIDSVVSKLNGTVISAENPLPVYLDYSITYRDGVEIENNHLIAAGDTETYRVRLEFKKDITNEQLPETDITPVFSVQAGYIQRSNGAAPVVHNMLGTISKKAILDNEASTYVTDANGVQFNRISSDTNGKGVYILAGTENNTYPIYYYRGDVDNNNLIFANFCWKIVRTTETGGIKLIYNGTVNDGKCDKTGAQTQLTNRTAYNGYYTSPASVGYMYGNRSVPSSLTLTNISDTYMYGASYDETTGKLSVDQSISIAGTDFNTSNYRDLSNYHYTCLNASGECSEVYYVFMDTPSSIYYYQIPSGKTIDDVLADLTTTSSNESSSSVKNFIDSWYASNMTSYTNMLEDTIWCNDRSAGELNGWNPNGGNVIKALYFSPYTRGRTQYSPSLDCPNKNDSFTVTESSVGNGKLTYPVGLLTSDEAMLAGGHLVYNNKNYYLYSGNNYWLMSPGNCGSISSVFKIDSSGTIVTNDVSASSFGARPSVSLKPGVVPTGGDGTANNPYVIE